MKPLSISACTPEHSKEVPQSLAVLILALEMQPTTVTPYISIIVVVAELQPLLVSFKTPSLARESRPIGYQAYFNTIQ